MTDILLVVLAFAFWFIGCAIAARGPRSVWIRVLLVFPCLVGMFFALQYV